MPFMGVLHECVTGVYSRGVCVWGGGGGVIQDCFRGVPQKCIQGVCSKSVFQWCISGGVIVVYKGYVGV